MARKSDISDAVWLTGVGAICALGILYLTLVWKDRQEVSRYRPLPPQNLHEPVFQDADSRARLRQEMGKKAR
jgi:hypothetical protein